MGFFSGFVGEMNRIEDRNERRELFLQKQADARLGTLAGLAKSGSLGKVFGSGGGGTASPASGSETDNVEATGGASSGNHYVNILKTKYGLSDDAIARTAASGGNESLAKAVEILNDRAAAYEPYGGLPDNFAAEMFENAIYTQDSTTEIDWGAVEEYVGRELDPVERQVFESTQAPSGGATEFYAPEFVEPLDPAKVKDVTGMALSDLVTKANRDMDRINELIGTYERQAEAGEDVSAEISYLSERANDINNAVKSAPDNPYDIVKMYGNTNMQKYENVYPAVRGTLPEVWAEAIEPPESVELPETVDPNGPFISNLIAQGLLLPDQVVIIGGRKYRVPGVQ